ncbi:MAG: sensor histidine kinase [Candidatus Sericytochromatia bacterium]
MPQPDGQRLAIDQGPYARRILDALPDLVYELDPAGRLVHWNQRLEAVTGYTPAELLGKDAMEFFPPDEQALHAESMRKKVEMGYDEVESYLLTKDGRLILHHWTGAALKDHAGRVIGIVGTARDVTERRRLEERLQAQNKRLMELDELKNAFVNSVSHELRTPLTSIQGYTEFLEDGIGGPLTPEQSEFIHHIAVGTRRLARLVDDLLDFARLEAGSFKLTMGPVELGGLIAEVTESLRPQAAAMQVRLVARLPDAPLTLTADAQRLEQVLTNIVHNALKFTPVDGCVTITLHPDGSEARIEVADTGVGIASEHQAHLFDKFYQTATSAPGAVGGAGLGLFIAKSLVEAHGGRIGVESVPGEGARFWFTVPIKKA